MKNNIYIWQETSSVTKRFTTFSVFVFKDNPTLKKYKIGTINELAENKHVKAAYNNTFLNTVHYGLISFYDDNGNLEMILMIDDTRSDEKELIEKWVGYLLMDKELQLAAEEEEEAEKQIDSEKDLSETSNLKILYAAGVNKNVITTEIEKMLYRIFRNAKVNRTIIITSTKREPESQAKAMINIVKNKGADAAKLLYNSKGDLVIDYYLKIKLLDENEVIRLTVLEMNRVGFLSAHCDWINKGAIDFGENTNGFNGNYSNEIQPIVEEAKKESMVNANQVFPPSIKESALHIEIQLIK